MNEVKILNNNTSITDQKGLIDAFAKLYSEDLVKDLTEILKSPPESVGDLQLVVQKLYQTAHKANSLVQFVQTFENISKNLIR